MELQKEFAEFLKSPIVRKAFAGLAESASVRLVIAGEAFRFRRVGEKFEWIDEKVAIEVVRLGDADLELSLTAAAAESILRRANAGDASVADVGKHAFDLVFSADPRKKVDFRVHASLFTLVRKGYFSVLIAGGPDMVRHLGRYGFGSLSKIRSVLQRTRGPKE